MMISLNFYAMAAAGTRHLDSPGSDNLYFIGVAGVVAISFLLIVVAIMVTIRRYYHKSKRANVPLELNEHIYDTPDSYDIRPSLPPRPSKLQRTDQLLYSVDTKQLRDHPIEDAQNCAQMEREELKETSCNHTQPTDDNCCHKLLGSLWLECPW